MAVLAQTLALLAMTVATMGIDVKTLDMALDSFDDQYQGCGTIMTRELPTLNRSEFQQNPLFAQAWLNATEEWRVQNTLESLVLGELFLVKDDRLSPTQAIALMAYTMKELELYKKFNEAVRVAGRSRQEYQNNFHFKTLHFLLTQALVTLRQSPGEQCHKVYRGVRDVRFKAKPGDIVRFGQFTSTSEREKTAKDFGSATVFHVYTCHGVGIQDFSKYPGEKEVLIPPFETFEVIEICQEKGERVRIQLNSTGTFSKYNCEWLQGGSHPRAPFHLGGLLLATTTLAVATGIL